jgi:hypothetical protein
VYGLVHSSVTTSSANDTLLSTSESESDREAVERVNTESSSSYVECRSFSTAQSLDLKVLRKSTNTNSSPCDDGG